MYIYRQICIERVSWATHFFHIFDVIDVYNRKKKSRYPCALKNWPIIKCSIENNKKILGVWIEAQESSHLNEQYIKKEEEKKIDGDQLKFPLFANSY